MGNGQKFGMAIIAMALGLGLGYLVFRPTMPRAGSAAAVSATDVVATRASAPAAMPAAAPVPTSEQVAAARAARDAESDREARIGDIDQQIRDLPDEDPQAATQLAAEIQLRREQVEELRARVADADQGLGSAGGSQPGADSQDQAELTANVAALQGQLTDAKESVSEEKRQISWIAATNDPGVIASLSNELARRSSIVNAIQQEIRDLFGAQQSDLEAQEAARAASVNSLRNDRNALASAYNEAVAGLSDAQERYQQLLSEMAAERKSARTLSAEKSGLLQR